MADPKKQLLAIQKRLDSAKEEAAELRGEKEAILKRLRRDYDIESLKEAVEALELVREEREKREAILTKKLPALYKKVIDNGRT